MSLRWHLLATFAAILAATSSAAPTDVISGQDDISADLEKLKGLLQRLQEKAESDDQTPPLKHMTEPMVEDDDDSLEEEIKQSDEKEGDNLTKWSKSLTLEDLRQLQVLKEIIDQEKEKLAPRQEGKKPHIEAETEEGTFGPFRDEIKYAIEKNLLSDVALAVHSGIKVEEILADLMDKAEEHEPVIWSKPVQKK